MPSERIQKLLAQAGISSRRKAEDLIRQGRVRVEGRVVTELGTKAPARARIEVDGLRVQKERLCYGVLNKPRQMVTTLSDPEGRPTAFDILRQVGLRVVPVGRLDFNTNGVLLFTNDGDFAQTLTHAKSRVPKVYLAKVRGELDDKKLARWSERIDIDGRLTNPAAVRAIKRENGHTWLEITLHEGRNRQVRRLGEHAGSSVVRLTRVSHAGINAEGLRSGQWRLLSVDELKTLKATYGAPTKLRGVVERREDLEPAPRTGQGASERASSRRRGEGRGASGRSAGARNEPERSFGRSRAGSPDSQGASGRSTGARNEPERSFGGSRSGSRGSQSARTTARGTTEKRFEGDRTVGRGAGLKARREEKASERGRADARVNPGGRAPRSGPRPQKRR